MTNIYSGQKICNTCDNPKHFDEFYATSTNKDKLMNICKECFQEKYQPKRSSQLTPVVLLRDSDIERNRKLREMTNEQVMTIVRGTIADERGRKDVSAGTPFITWDRLIATKLVSPTKF